MKTEKMGFTYPLLTILALLTATILGRGMGYIYSTMATDIAFSDLAVTVVGILVELLSILRTVIGFCAIVYAMYRYEKSGSRYRCGGLVTFCVILGEALDCLSRYLVDSLTSSITDLEIMAALWLILQFCYSTILVMLCFCTGRILFSPAAGKTPASPARVLTQSICYLLGTRLALEIFYLVDFLTTYSNITGTEIASIIGQFLYTIVLYGCGAWGLAMVLFAWLRGRETTSAEPEEF